MPHGRRLQRFVFLVLDVLFGRAGSEMLIRSLGSNIKLYTDGIAGVSVLGSEKPVVWSRDPEGLRVRVNDEGQFGMVLKISRQ